MNLCAVTVLLLLLLIAGQTGAAIGAPVPDRELSSQPIATNAVAVADFELADATRGSEDWAFGLADVFAVELRQRGVVLFERQQIRMVLGERKLTASGLMQLRGSPAQQIPDLQFIVAGNIRPLTNRMFHLEASLIEPRTGRNSASVAQDGRYPADLPAALAALGEQIAGRLKSAGVALAPSPVVSASPTRTPEVSLLFYKGVSCCLAGQPELGVTWFIDAQKAAPGFLPARLWTARAFEMIGLPDFAEVARAKLRQLPAGQAVLNRLGESPFLNRRMVSVAVIADPRLNSAGWQFQTELKTALGRATNLFVADPLNIHTLAAEMDLQLTEKGARDLELASVLWSTMDALVLITADQTQPGHFSVELRDALSGAGLFRTQSGSALSEVERVSRELAHQIEATRRTSPAEATVKPVRPTGAVKPAQVSNTDRNEFAGLLRYLAENPADRPAWMRLSLFFPWLTGRTDGSYECLMFNRVIAATDLTKPDAPHWLSEALWRKRAYSCSTSIATDAAILLQRFPKTPEGSYARSALALEYIDRQDYSNAVAILVQLSKDLPQLPPSIQIEPDYWASFYFFTAFALEKTGEAARAREFLARADAVVSKNPEMLIHDGNTYQLGVWVNHFPVHHALYGPGRDVRQAVAEWQLRLHPVNFANGRAMTLEQLEVMLTQAKQSPANAAWSNRVAFLERLIELKQSNPDLFKGRINESTWQGAYREVDTRQGTTYGHFNLPGALVMEATTLLGKMATETPQNINETRRLAAMLADGLDPQVAAECFTAVSELQRALEKVEEAITHPSPFPPAPSMHPTPQQTAEKMLRGRKIELLQALGRKSDAMNYAMAQAELPERDADAKLAAVLDFVRLCIADHRSEQACQILAKFVRDRETNGIMTAQTATARLWWADEEIARGNTFEASELLRAVTKQAEGKGWGVYLRTGFANPYNAAVSRLANLRQQSSFPVSSTAWEPQPRRAGVAPATGSSNRTELEQQLDAILRGTDTGGGGRTFGGAAVTEFSRKFGRTAVPAVLAAALEDEAAARLIGSLRLLDRIATAEDTSAVLDAFKQTPYLAETAFRLDRTNATLILRERFSIYAKGGNVPRELRQALAQYAVLDQYPVLMANLAAKALDGNTVLIATELDAMLPTNSPPELLASYRAALATAIERQMLSGYRHGLAAMGEIALRRGWPEGLDALLHGGDPS